MTSNNQIDLETALVGFSQLYPDLRFGQLLEMVAVLASEESQENLFDIDDARLIQAAAGHLSKRLQQLRGEVTSVATSMPPARIDLLLLLSRVSRSTTQLGVSGNWYPALLAGPESRSTMWKTGNCWPSAASVWSVVRPA